MKLWIEIRMDNAAFCDESTDDVDSDRHASARAREVARILRKEADSLESGSLEVGDETFLRDYNGNKVGKLHVTDD